jgi:hypothetical protein
MTERSFQMRLSCRYEDPNNSIADLRVEHLVDGEWRDLNLHIGAPGFLIFVYAIFTCQHLYLRANAAERGLAMASARGTIDAKATEDWALQRLHLRFEAELQAGTPSAEDVSYIVGRMKQCPASRNLREIPDTQTVVDFVK